MGGDIDNVHLQWGRARAVARAFCALDKCDQSAPTNTMVGGGGLEYPPGQQVVQEFSPSKIFKIKVQNGWNEMKNAFIALSLVL